MLSTSKQVESHFYIFIYVYESRIHHYRCNKYCFNCINEETKLLCGVCTQLNLCMPLETTVPETENVPRQSLQIIEHNFTFFHDICCYIRNCKPPFLCVSFYKCYHWQWRHQPPTKKNRGMNSISKRKKNDFFWNAILQF